MASKTKRESWDAVAVAGIASGMTPRAWTSKQVRGIARGDSGPAVLPRFAERNADGTNRSHVYTLAEVRLLLEAIAARQSKRTGQAVRVPAPFGTAPRKRTTSKAAPRKARKATATVATEAATDAA
jgi:hypothetical protein